MRSIWGKKKKNVFAYLITQTIFEYEYIFLDYLYILNGKKTIVLIKAAVFSRAENPPYRYFKRFNIAVIQMANGFTFLIKHFINKSM